MAQPKHQYFYAGLAFGLTFADYRSVGTRSGRWAVGGSLAAHQGGIFTARQARQAGYEDNVHPYHVRFPLPSRPDLMVWQLWSRNRQDEPQGVFSHATALDLHELSDVMPATLHMTVPPGFRRMAAIPEVPRLHRARLADRDVQTIDGVRVTTPQRTLVDVIAEGAIAQERFDPLSSMASSALWIHLLAETSDRI